MGDDLMRMNGIVDEWMTASIPNNIIYSKYKMNEQFIDESTYEWTHG